MFDKSVATGGCLIWSLILIVIWLFPIWFTFTTMTDKGYPFIISAITSLFSWVGVLLSILAPVS